MRKSSINSLIRIVKRKMENNDIHLEGEKRRFLWSIVRYPVDLSDSAINFLLEIKTGKYDKKDKN